MEYLHWKEETITDFSEEHISRMYGQGFVFTRIGRGAMHQTRSVRIDLSKFELTSENRRVLKKVGEIKMEIISLPEKNYHWSLGKLAKDFYDKKAPNSFSVNKIKELITTSHNFNILLSFSNLGYSICYGNSSLLHYSYPFYDLEKSPKDMGLGMMTMAIAWAKKQGLRYVYLGSLQRPGDVYKLQFAGLEWFDGKGWNGDTEKVKMMLQAK